MVKANSLTTTIFWDISFVLYTQHILNLAKKLGLKIENLNIDIVKERIEQIWSIKYW